MREEDTDGKCNIQEKFTCKIELGELEDCGVLMCRAGDATRNDWHMDIGQRHRSMQFP
jgi:hypothetical protein